MKLSLVVLLAVIGWATAADSQVNCFGSICDTATQYCQIDIHDQSGHCYTHHGHGHHEDHQKCEGAHHPGSHCFCNTNNCVTDIVGTFTTTTSAPTTDMPTTV